MFGGSRIRAFVGGRLTEKRRSTRHSSRASVFNLGVVYAMLTVVLVSIDFAAFVV